MASKDAAIKALCKSLGKEYRVCTIDFEPVIYRDFGNGFNVEISGVYTTSKTRKATLYLWYGETQPECMIVKTVREVAREEIAEAVERLLHYSYTLIADGFDTRDKLYRHKFPVTNCVKGGSDMRYKFFYGAEPQFSDRDLQNFSRGGYVCKKLLQNRNGQPVVISQSKDEDAPIWKVEYGFSCLVFGTFDEAMAFCKGRFTDCNGREV